MSVARRQTEREKQQKEPELLTQEFHSLQRSAEERLAEQASRGKKTTTKTPQHGCRS